MGERHLPEREATWLPGHHGSAPVRTGNAAAGQFQLDVYGEIADARYWLMLEKGFADGQQHLIHRVLAVLGIDEGEGAFLACSFWLADALALSGRPDEARTLFERSLTRCNDVGLLAKHYDPHRGRLVGNFPQALSHLALVNTALLSLGGGGPGRRESAAITARSAQVRPRAGNLTAQNRHLIPERQDISASPAASPRASTGQPNTWTMNRRKRRMTTSAGIRAADQACRQDSGTAQGPVDGPR